MTDDIIERAARALCTSYDPDDTSGGTHPTGIWLDKGEAWWTGYKETVRIVLSAIREPSEAMVSSAMEDWDKTGRVDLYGPGTEDYRGTWQAMIDAALEDG